LFTALKQERLRADQAEALATEKEHRLQIARTQYREVRPKVAVYEQFLNSKKSYTLAEAAKLLSDDLGATTCEKRLFQYLREKKPLMTGYRMMGGERLETDRRNEPYQRIVEVGYLTLRLAPDPKSDCMWKQVLIAPKGMVRIFRDFEKPIKQRQAAQPAE
jgi:phage antirepressor YoqD-like protein